MKGDGSGEEVAQLEAVLEGASLAASSTKTVAHLARSGGGWRPWPAGELADVLVV
jgi:hypothetical protein